MRHETRERREARGVAAVALLSSSLLLLPSVAASSSSSPYQSAALPPAAFERGGVTFDFAACSARRIPTTIDRTGNLLDKEVKGRLPDGAKSGEWNRLTIWPFPVATGQWYRVSLRYRKAPHPGADVGPKTMLLLRPWKWDEAKKRYDTVDNYASDESQNMWATRSEWAVVSQKVQAVPGTTHLLVYIRRATKDQAPIEYEDLTIVPEVATKASVEVLPVVAGYLDGRQVIGEGQTTEIEYAIHPKGGAKVDRTKLTFTCEVPAGVEMMDATAIKPGTLKRTANADGSSTVSFSIGDTKPIMVLLKATGRQGVCGALKVRVSLDEKGAKGTDRPQWGGRHYDAEPIQIEIGPKVKARAVPKRYANGADIGIGAHNLSEAGFAAFTETLVDGGVTWVNSHCVPNERFDYWHQHGIRYVTPEPDYVFNGYWIIAPGEWPKEDRWVMRKNQPMFLHYDYVERSPCPIAVYEESETFRTKMVPFIEKISKGTDGCLANWEPWMYRNMGCFCDKCCHAFANRIGLPYDEIAKGWPDNVRPGGAWHDRYNKFRSWQHSRVVETLDKYFTAASGGEKSLGFIAGICWIEMGSWWRPRNYVPEVQAIDYADKRKWMCPWGPYAKWEADQPYAYNKERPLCHYFAAKDVRETVDRDYPLASRPKLLSMPQAFQCGSWVTQPEHIGMAHDSFFFNGWEATMAYFFPCGYDSRYWAKFADATERAAKYEDIVCFGKRSDARVTLEPVKDLYAVPVKFLSGYLPACTNVSMLQQATYCWGSQNIVAVMNFWQKGEAFFTLKFAGLGATNNYTIVSETGVLRAKDAANTTWTGAELAKGVLLHVGAARTRVFEICSADASSVDAIVPIASAKEKTSSADADETSASTRETSASTSASTIMTDEAINKELEARRPILKSAAEKDAIYERGSFEKTGTSSDKDLPVI